MPRSISLEQLAKSELALGAEFSSGFKIWVARTNGGYLSVSGESWFLIPFRDDSDRDALRRTAEDVVRATRSAREDELFPEDGVVIGHNGSGDYLFLRRGDGNVLNELWVFRLRGGELEMVATDVDAIL